MPTDQLTDPLRIFLSDPILFVGAFLPVVILAALVIYRIRISRRFASFAKRNAEVRDETKARWQEVAARNAEARDENTARWQEAAARTEKMIGLLTEIRDQLARISPRDGSSKTF
jgi:uncharacterized membrane protein YccC